MKKLFVVRHGKSSWKYKGVRDLDRPLKERGVLDSESVAGELARQAPGIERVYTSPSARTVSTALIFARILGVPFQNIEIREELYDAFLADFLNFVRGINNEYSSVLIAAHNPLITYVAEIIGHIPTDNVPTAGLIELNLKINSWSEFSENSPSENNKLTSAKSIQY